MRRRRRRRRMRTRISCVEETVNLVIGNGFKLPPSARPMPMNLNLLLQHPKRKDLVSRHSIHLILAARPFR